ncbi:MAG: hypothetical protein ABIA78_03050 [archaeon]
MDKQEFIKKITAKKEFSQLPKKDVEMAYEKFDKSVYSDEEKIKLTRDLLRKVFSAFTSQKLLNLKNKDAEWILKKHLSTRERLPYYEELYEKLLGDLKRSSAYPKLRNEGVELNIFDLGAGINGLSYNQIEKINRDFCYVGVEAVGQLVELANYHFKTRGVENCMVLHMSLFELEKIKKIIKQVKGRKVVFLFKTIDSLEMLERDYSKKLLKEIVPSVDRVVVSFATESMVKRRKFNVNRKWIVNFIKDNFKVVDDFVLGGERYIAFGKK